MSLKNMVVSSAKFNIFLPWSHTCTPFIRELAWMKIASTLAEIIYNNIESTHPWWTHCIRVKGLHRRPFILILDWIQESYRCIRSWNQSYERQRKWKPNPPFQKSKKIPRKPREITVKWLFFKCIWNISYVVYGRKSVILLFLIAADYFNLLLRLRLFACDPWRLWCRFSILSLEVRWVCGLQYFLITFFIYNRNDSRSIATTQGVKLFAELINI